MVGSGFHGHFANLGDWMPDTPSPRTLFSAVLDRGNANHDICLEDRNDEHKHSTVLNDELNQFSASSSSPMQQKLSFQGRLVDRMAARAGFNAPRLNTECIRASDLPSNQSHPNIRSPYLTIPPGLSPTTLLESPVFLSNSLVQPSPTTGKFHFLPNVNLTSLPDPDVRKDTFFENINNSPIEFKPPAERGSSFPCIVMPSTEFENSAQSHNQNRVDNVRSDLCRDGKDTNAMEEDEEGDQNVSGGGIVFSEDGYNWRKYGQKHVKGSEYPRSYFKCTHSTCPVKKKVERSLAGNITEIIYKGMHNHAKPPLNRRSTSAVGSSSLASSEMMQVESGDGDVVVWANPQSNDVTSSTSVDVSSTFSNDEDDDDRGTHGSVSLGYDGEGDESESKRRKIESEMGGAEMSGAEMGGATRAVRKPRVVVQTTSEVDILDDGYRWRKYGQKVVKGNPNPRSYYKCTNSGCDVRKHVERASHDFKSVITTYEGKHNHDIPAARNANHAPNPPVASTSTAAPPEPQRGSLHCPNNPAALRMMGFHQVPGIHHHLDPGQGQGRGFYFGGPYFGEEVPGQMEFAPKVEDGVAIRGPSVYHQIMNRLPLGPQM